MCRAFIVTVLALAPAATSVAVQQPRVGNGEITAQAAGSPFDAWFRVLVASEPGVAWIGYAVPSARRDSMSCCFTSSASTGAGTVVMTAGCHIEPSADGRSAVFPSLPAPSGPVRIEPPDHAFVMFRVVERQIERIRTFSEGCDLDAGGRPIRWLEGVRPADSVGLLASWCRPPIVATRW